MLAAAVAGPAHAAVAAPAAQARAGRLRAAGSVRHAAQQRKPGRRVRQRRRAGGARPLPHALRACARAFRSRARRSTPGPPRPRTPRAPRVSMLLSGVDFYQMFNTDQKLQQMISIGARAGADPLHAARRRHRVSAGGRRRLRHGGRRPRALLLSQLRVRLERAVHGGVRGWQGEPRFPGRRRHHLLRELLMSESPTISFQGAARTVTGSRHLIRCRRTARAVRLRALPGPPRRGGAHQSQLRLRARRAGLRWCCRTRISITPATCRRWWRRAIAAKCTPRPPPPSCAACCCPIRRS